MKIAAFSGAKQLASVFCISIMVISMSGCSAVETSTQLYQLCKYQNKCPVEVLGDWLNGK